MLDKDYLLHYLLQGVDSTCPFFSLSQLQVANILDFVRKKNLIRGANLGMVNAEGNPDFSEAVSFVRVFQIVCTEMKVQTNAIQGPVQSPSAQVVQAYLGTDPMQAKLVACLITGAGVTNVL